MIKSYNPNYRTFAADPARWFWRALYITTLVCGVDVVSLCRCVYSKVKVASPLMNKLPLLLPPYGRLVRIKISRIG